MSNPKREGWPLGEALQHIASCCGDGWLPLVEEVYARCPADRVVVQVYQKWGELRVDTAPAELGSSDEDELFDAYLARVARRSARICQVCGRGDAREQLVKGWSETLCSDPACARRMRALGAARRR